MFQIFETNNKDNFFFGSSILTCSKFFHMPKMVFRAFAFNICFVVALAGDVAVDVTRGRLAGDDECSGDDKQCALSMLQLQQAQSDDSRICRMSALYLYFTVNGLVKMFAMWTQFHNTLSYGVGNLG